MYGLALCYSAREYASLVWRMLAHAKRVYVALNNTNRIITGCLKPTSGGTIQILSWIALPDIGKKRSSSNGGKEETDKRSQTPLVW